MKQQDNNLPISEDIKSLNVNILDDNIFHYDYNIRHLLKIQKSNMNVESPIKLLNVPIYSGDSTSILLF